MPHFPNLFEEELAGHSFGKYGTDTIIPGALAKASAKGMRGAQELSAVSKCFKTAKSTFLMELVTGMGSSTKIEKIVQLEKRISNWLGKEISQIYPIDIPHK